MTFLRPHDEASTEVGQLRVLLIQARDTEIIERQEQLCFLERCRLQEDQLRTVNLTCETLRPSLQEEVDAILIGGAGEYSVTGELPWLESLFDFLRAVVRRELPIFGSCWGHQVLARFFGGEVIYDSERAELGSRWMALTDAGKQDPLFGTLPSRFRVNTGHHDRVARLPADAVELAYNESQRNQAFRIKGLPVYGTQFHSELDADRERERLIAYRDYYRTELPTEEAFQRAIRELAETTEVDDLLYDFLRRYAVPRRGTSREA